MSRVALITGAAGGIGQALCEEFTKRGYAVIATDRTENSQLACTHFITADLEEVAREDEAWQRLRMEIETRLPEGKLAALVNNAAVQVVRKAAELSREDWETTLGVNVVAPFVVVQGLLEPLRRAGGAVVNIASVHARATKPGFVCYATSKAALIGLTRALAVDIGPHVRINSINPAATATPMLEAGFEGKRERYRLLSDMHPLGRIAEPAEIARVAAFLASEDASFLTGTTVDADGGILSRLHDPE